MCNQQTVLLSQHLLVERLWGFDRAFGLGFRSRASIAPSTSVRDLGVVLESDLSMRRHVTWTIGCYFGQLRLIRSCIKSLPFEAATAAVAAFVISHVDRCNSLLAGRPGVSWTDSSRCSVLRSGSSATGGNTMPLRPSWATFCTGCLFRSILSSRSDCLCLNHSMGERPSIYVASAPRLIPLRPDCNLYRSRKKIDLRVHNCQSGFSRITFKREGTFKFL